MRLIDADKLLEVLNKKSVPFNANANDAILTAPTVAERKKGKWIIKDDIYGVAYCNLCDYELHTNDTKFCPNCGADMRGERKEEL